MNQADLQNIEDFNAQCDDVAEKVDKLIKYLNECFAIQLDSIEKEVEVLGCVQKGLDNFDLYTFIDFVEGEQANELQLVINNFQNKYQSTHNQEIIQSIINYNNLLETRLMYLEQIQRNQNDHYYKFDSDQANNEDQQPSEQMEIEYTPVKLMQIPLFSDPNNRFQ